VSVAERRWPRLRAALEILATHPDGMHVQELWRRICERIPLEPEDLRVNASGKERGSTDFRWHSFDLVKAGWLEKSGTGVWLTTDAGRQALADHPDATDFGREASRLYREGSLGQPQPRVADDSSIDLLDLSVLPARSGEPFVLTAARLLLETGLRRGGSAFDGSRAAWTEAAATELYDGFVLRPDDDSGANFLTKLQRQLADAGDDALLLAAELLTLNVLPLANVGADAKRIRIQRVLGWMRRPATIPAEIEEAFGFGTFHGGIGFNVHVWTSLSLLIQFVRHWHTLDPADREEALDDPWAWRNVVYTSPGPKIPAQRDALLYLAHPETFLPIVNRDHRRRIRDAFRDQIDRPTTDIDRDLLQITLALQVDGHAPIDYYRPPYVEVWKPAADGAPDEAVDPARRAWLVRGASAGGVNLVPDWLHDGFVSLPAPGLRQVTQGIDRAELRRVVEEDYAHRSYADRADRATELHAFLSRMDVGHLVVTMSGGKVYLGVVTGPVAWTESEGSRSNLRRNVDWRNVDEPVDFAELPAPLPAKLASQLAVVDLTDELTILEPLHDERLTAPEPAAAAVLPDVDEALAQELLVDRAWLQDLVGLLRERRQVILYGPPGTGKTFLATRLARNLTSSYAVRLVQFHPSYSYEDFFEGYRPVPGDDGLLRFELRPGPFRRLAEAARKDPGTPYVLVVDEINRANLAKVFGELYFLLEYRDESVGLLYSAGDGDEFTMPGNVYVIGTMNTADRSIALLDTAMRRRFAFVPLHPAEEPVRDLLRSWLDVQGLPADAADLLDELNALLADRDYAIGPSYLMRPEACSPGGMERVWRTSIRPLLEELHYGERVDLDAMYGLPALRRRTAAREIGEP
jgi:5-methylcytosine-specific restriction protein B